MSDIKWLHLSDWHQKGPDFDRVVVRDALINDLRNRSEISPALTKLDFVVFSGDLTFSGKEEEFNAAKQHLLDPVMQALELPASRLFMVPGNHDLSRETVVDMLPPELQNPFESDAMVQKWLDNPKRLVRALEPFSDYRKFVEGYSGQPFPDYSSIVRFEFGGTKIALLGLNSAWMNARRKDATGKLNDYGVSLIGEPQVHHALGQIADADLRIVVVHHPFDWLAEFDRNHVEARLTRDCHFILRGHMHSTQIKLLGGTEGDCVVIPGGACYDRREASNPRYTNSYNWVHLDLAANQGSIYLRRWSDSRNEWIEDSDAAKGGKFVLRELPKQLASEKGKLQRPLQEADRDTHRHKTTRELEILEGYVAALIRHNADLDSGGIKQTKVQVVLPLDEIYVGLQADQDRPDVDHRVMREELDEIKKRLEREEDPRERERQYQIWATHTRALQQALEISGPRENLDDIVKRHRQLVILGNPGSGKTTLVRYLTLRLARAVLTDPQRIMMPQELWDESRIWRIPELGPVRLPILMKISHYAEARIKDPDLALVDYLPRYFSGLSVPYADELGPLLQRLLEQGRCMVMLDGLDEIVDPADRRNIAAAIGQFAGVYRDTGLPTWLYNSISTSSGRPDGEVKGVNTGSDDDRSVVIHWEKGTPEDFRSSLEKQLRTLRVSVRRRERAVRLAWDVLGEARAAHLGNRFVITSRIAGYHFANIPGEFEHFTIRRMAMEDIKRFLEKWCPAVERRIAGTPDQTEVDRRARREIEGIQRAVETTPGVRRMAENPLLLRILAIIHRNEAHLPQRRVELYETATVTLLRDWNLERGAKDTAIDDVKATSLLGPLAFYIHEKRASGFLSKGEAHRILAGILARDRGERDPENPSLETQAAVSKFLDTVREHSGIFVERGEGLFGFMHLTFEEYFTARQLVSSSGRARQLILQRLHLPRWREPILLAVGSLSKQFYDDTQDLLNAILEAGSPYELSLHRDLLFAAECVADSVNVAPIVRENIAERLLTLWCDRKNAGRYRLLRRQIKEALISLCNDQGDRAVEIALAKALRSRCSDHFALISLLDVTEWLRARTPPVVQALTDCRKAGWSARLEKVLQDTQARVMEPAMGRQTSFGWEGARENPSLHKLLGALLCGNCRDQMLSVLGISEGSAEEASKELRPLEELKPLGACLRVLNRIDERDIRERDEMFWEEVFSDLPLLSSVAMSDLQVPTEELSAAITQLYQTANNSAEEVQARPKTENTRPEVNEPALDLFAGAIGRFREAVQSTARNLSWIDPARLLTAAGAILSRTATSAGSLAPIFVAAAESATLEYVIDDGTIRTSTGRSADLEIVYAILAGLHAPSTGIQYADAANYIASCVETEWQALNYEDPEIRSAAIAVLSADLDSGHTLRRQFVLHALASPEVRRLVPLTPAHRNLLIQLVENGQDESLAALEILFALGLTPELLTATWRVLRLPAHPLKDAALEKLDGIAEVQGDTAILELVHEGLVDPRLRSSAIELMRKLTWQGSATFAQVVIWLEATDAEVRSIAARLLSARLDILEDLRSLLFKAVEALTKDSPEVSQTLDHGSQSKLDNLLTTLWTNGWDDALCQLWTGKTKERYVRNSYWLRGLSKPTPIFRKAEYGHRLTPIFADAAIRFAELQQEGSGSSLGSNGAEGLKSDIIDRLEEYAVSDSTPPLLRTEANRLLKAVGGGQAEDIEEGVIAAAIEGGDMEDRLAVFLLLAAKPEQETRAAAVLKETLGHYPEQARMQLLLALSDLPNRTSLCRGVSSQLASWLFDGAPDIPQALLLIASLIESETPDGLILKLRSLVFSQPATRLSKWLTDSLAVHDLNVQAKPAELSRLLLSDSAETRAAAALALLIGDLHATVVSALIEGVKSNDDRIRRSTEQRLPTVCAYLPTDGSSTAIELLQNLRQQSLSSGDPHLGTLSAGAFASVIHRHPYWILLWLQAIREAKEEDVVKLHILSDLKVGSDHVLSTLFELLRDRSQPMNVRQFIVSMFDSIQLSQIEMREHAGIHDALLLLLEDPDSELRSNAAEVLQWATGQAAWRLLIPVLQSIKSEAEVPVRVQLIWTIGCLLHHLRSREIDLSKPALLRWLTNAANNGGEWSSLYGAIESLNGFVPLETAKDAQETLQVLSDPEAHATLEHPLYQLKTKEWQSLLSKARNEWETRQFLERRQPDIVSAVSAIESLLSAKDPKEARMAAAAVARLYHSDAERIQILKDLLAGDARVLQALLDADTDRAIWGEAGAAVQSYHHDGAKQIAGWIEAKSSEEQGSFITSLLESLNREYEGNTLKAENGHLPIEERGGWPARCILAAVLAELSERLTYRAFTHKYDLGTVVALFTVAAIDPGDYETRRFAVRLLGNLQQLDRQVADVFFAACEDVGEVYRETRRAVTRFKVFGPGSLERLTAAIRSPSITVAQQAAVLLGELGLSRSDDLGPDGRRRVADELVQLLDDPIATRIAYEFGEDPNGIRIGPLYDVIYEALVRVVAGPDAPVFQEAPAVETTLALAAASSAG